MANTVIALRKSATPSAVPINLANGEIAINYADGILYYKAANGTIASISGSGGGGGNNFGTVNANGTLLVSDTTGDVFAILPGDNITIVGDAINDRLTINANLTAANNYAGAMANGAGTIANAAFAAANAEYTFSNTVYAAVNSAFAVINAAYTSSNADYVVSNAAFAKANAALANTTGTFNGTLSVAGDIISVNAGITKIGWNNSGQYFNWFEAGGTPGNNYIRFATGNAERMRLANSNLGIGTATPAYPLDVAGTINGLSSASDVNGMRVTATAGYDSWLNLYRQGYVNWYFGTVNNSTRLDIKNDSLTAMSITGGGFVGINTTSPKTLLDVKPSSSSNTFSIVLTSGQILNGFGSLRYAASYAHNDLLIGNFQDDGGRSQTAISFGHTVDPARKFHIGSSNSATFDANASFVPAVTITSGGNVGIGTTAPGYKLDVAGSANISLPTLLVAGQNVLASFASGNNYAGAMANSSNGFTSTVYTAVNSAFAVINAAYTSSNADFTVSNAAFAKANAALANTTGTFAGSLTTTGSLTATGSFSANTISVMPQNGAGEGGEIQILGSGSNPSWVIDVVGTSLRHFSGFVGVQTVSFFNDKGGANVVNMSVDGTAIINGMNITPTIIASYNTTNGAFTFANGVATNTTAAFGLSNNVYAAVNSAFAVINAAYTSSNADYVLTNAVFTQSNTDNVRLSAAYVSLNAGYTVANAAYGNANSVAVAANNYAGAMANSGNSWTQTIVDANLITARAYTNTSTTAANNYAGVMANSANAIAIATFGTITNTTAAFAAANQAGVVANNANTFAGTTYVKKSGDTITGDLVVQGNLTTSGVVTYANTQTLLIGDALITLNNDIPIAVAPSEDAGIEVKRGSSANVSLLWREGNDKWTLTNDGTIWYSIATNNDVTSANNYAGVMANSANAIATATFGTITNTTAAFAFANGVATNTTAAFAAANAKVASVSGTSGRITSSGGTTPTIDLATSGVTATTYGGATQIPVITVDAFGRLTSASNVAVSSTGLANTSGVYFAGDLFFPNGNVGVGATTSAGYRLYVNGSFAANTKSFVIPHPTKSGMKLRYGSLEGPENGVYVRGKIEGNEIELPDYWTGLVHEDSITVQLTAIGRSQDLYVVEISNNRVYIDSSNHTTPKCFYTIYAERKDVEKLIVEY